jgi:8-oxo-dGTP pyrophosphatase MutT (NUDIX family)
MAKLRTTRAFSAGGVVFRLLPEVTPSAVQNANQPERAWAEVVLVGRARENFWVLPKGTPIAGETTEAVALREVAEETGVTGRILNELGSINYWFSRHGVRYSKEVLYYLIEATGGDVSQHDHEYDDARWFPYDTAAGTLTYANEAEIMRRAAQLIAQQAAGGNARQP